MVRIQGLSTHPSASARSRGSRLTSRSGLGSDLEALFGHFFEPTATQRPAAPQPSSEQSPTEQPVTWVPRIAVAESPEAFELRAELAGVAREDIEIDIKDEVLTISGLRKPLYAETAGEEASSEAQASKYRARGREWYDGRFERRVRVGSDIAVDEVSASLRDGILTLTLPKRPELKPRRVAIGE